MSEEFLTTREAARRLAISAATLYDWLGRSDHGLLIVRGQLVRIDYLQSGPKGQGCIRIPAREVERLKDLMRVRPRHAAPRQPPVRPAAYPGIHVPLGRPAGG